MPAEFERDRLTKKQAEKEKAKEKTLFQLCDYFADNHIKPPVYVGHRKVAGYAQNHRSMKSDIEQFKAFFGNVPLSLIGYPDLMRFANFLAGTTDGRVKSDRPAQFLGAATINKKLGFLRHLLNIAVDELDWLAKSPFKRGAKLIHKSAETERSRIMTFEEESVILDRCNTDKRKHVKYFVILAVDTAMRRSEIYNLRWWQVDFKKRLIYLTKDAAKHSKTGAEGILPMTGRVHEVLQELKTSRAAGPNDVVLGQCDIKRAWKAICDEAGIENLQFRDLRASAVVRLLQAGVPGDFVRKISRHSKTTDIFLKHYTRVDESNAQEIGQILTEYNENKAVKADFKVEEISTLPA